MNKIALLACIGMLPLLTTAAAQAQPANDACANAVAVAAQVTTPWNPLGATQSVVLPCDNFPEGAIDVWYKYTTTGPETVTVTTCGGATEFTSVGVFASCSGAPIACDSWSCSALSQSQVTFSAPSAGTYYICLVGYTDFEGPGLFAINAPVTAPPPANDTCAGAQILAGPGSYDFDSLGAATDGASAGCGIGGRPDTHDVYFRYTPTVTGWYVFDTVQSPPSGVRLNTTLQVLDGCSGAVLACNDDVNWTGVFSGLWPGSRTCPLQLTAGTGYIVRVASAGAGSSGGKGALRLSSASGPLVYAAPADAVPEPGPACEDDYASDVNYGCNPRLSPPDYRATPAQFCTAYTGHIHARSTPASDGTLVHDFDAYSFTLTSPQTITVTGQTQFIGTITLAALPCGVGTVYSGDIDQYPNPECGAGNFTISWTLTPGSYTLGIGTAAFGQPACGSSDEYWFRITSSVPCPPASVTCCRGTTCVVMAAASCTAPAGIGVRTVAGASCAGQAASNAGCCYADFDKVGGRTIDDIFIYLNAWFANSPFTKVGGDGSGARTIDDIFIFLNAWFSGCT